MSGEWGVSGGQGAGEEGSREAGKKAYSL